MIASTGSLDKTLKLWDLAASNPSNQCRLSFTGHKDFVLSVAFSPNGNKNFSRLDYRFPAVLRCRLTFGHYSLYREQAVG